MDEPLSESPMPEEPAAPGAPVAGFSELLIAKLGPIEESLQVVSHVAMAFANANAGRGQWVLDIQAVLMALRDTTPAGNDGAAHDMLQKWMQTEQLRLPHVHKEAISGARDLEPTLSASLLNPVLPTLLGVRDRVRRQGTNAIPLPAVRHLVAALATMDIVHWPPAAIDPKLAPAATARLRKILSEAATTIATESESPDQWRSLLAGGAVGPRPAERTPLLSDSPAAVDELGRKPLADALAARLVRLQREEVVSRDPNAVMVHLNGPWGSGKSSLVRFLSDALGRESPRWLVVEFNAWRNARVNPPWWNMLTELKRALSRRLLADVMPLRWAWLQLRWGWVSPTVDNVVLIAALLLLAAFLFAGGQFDKTLATLRLTGSGEWVKSLKDLPAQLTLISGGLAAIVALMRGLLLGGKRVAESFDALRTDSFRPFISLFDMLVKSAPCAVLIVLDDLDRCKQETVTDLLEGIQTLFRGQPVVFLAVADRHWITASFGERFKLFGRGVEARPVGDMFLDKMFQLSVSVPQFGPAVQERFLKKLLGVVKPEDAPETDATPPVTLAATDLDQESITGKIAQARKPQDKDRLTAQGVMQLATAAADEKLSHRLEQFAEHIEANPRAIKRLINAIGLNQARILLERRPVDFDTITRWTILDLRWPHVAGWIENDWPKTVPPKIPDQNLNIWLSTVPDRPRYVIKVLADPSFEELSRAISLQMAYALLGPLPPA